MKSLFALALISLASAPAFANEVQSARYNANTNAIEIDVTYGGGCEEHKFKLQMGACLESFPVSCSAQLIDVSDNYDPCEAMVGETVSITLKEAGLDDDYFNGAWISIEGSNNSSASVKLPLRN